MAAQGNWRGLSHVAEQWRGGACEPLTTRSRAQHEDTFLLFVLLFVRMVQVSPECDEDAPEGDGVGASSVP